MKLTTWMKKNYLRNIKNATTIAVESHGKLSGDVDMVRFQNLMIEMFLKSANIYLNGLAIDLEMGIS